MAKLILTSWDGRPAVINSSGTKAVAIHRPGSDWVSVDALDVFNSGKVVSDPEVFMRKFSKRFGSFKIPSEL